MSALIRYFLSKGKFVAGYDRTPNELTGHLIAEGAQIHYEENNGLIPENCKDKESTLVVYTPPFLRSMPNWPISGRMVSRYINVPRYWARLPAAAKDSQRCRYAWQDHHKYNGGASLPPVACGLHGFSRRHLQEHGQTCSYQTSPYTVIQADEFDRSFHWLSPYMSVITSTDPDHFGHIRYARGYLESFRHYTTLIQTGRALIIRKGLPCSRMYSRA